MGRPKGRITDTENIGLRMPNDLIKSMDQFAEDRKMTRSGVINQAVEDMVNSIECINCGTLNNGNGWICSHCGEILYSDETISGIMSNSLPSLFNQKCVTGDDVPEVVKRISAEIRVQINGFDKYTKLGLKPKAEFIIDRKAGETQFLLKFHFVADGGVDVVPTESDSSVVLDKLYVLTACNSFFEGFTSRLGKDFGNALALVRANIDEVIKVINDGFSQSKNDIEKYMDGELGKQIGKNKKQNSNKTE